MQDMRKLPIGIQSFEKIREEGFVYVDKTDYIYRLIKSGAPYFLSRPRRFGKSLLLSTMRAYWEGKKELFKGLAIEELSKDDPESFIPHPVLYFDMNQDNFQDKFILEKVLERHLVEWEKEYDVEDQADTLAARFQTVIKTAYDKTGRPVVVLVDEYDKPLLEVMTNAELEEHNKAVFKGFFSTLKSYDRYLKFVFLTGVTKFSKVSIFSDLNQLMDISMDKDYAEICGITEAEIKQNFIPEVSTMANEMGLSEENCLDGLREMYNGYHFHPVSAGVYNPFSLLNALGKREYGSFWFSTGTPTFLVKKLKSNNFDPGKFTDGTLYADGNSLSDYRADNPDPVPLLYQTGYLTIKDYDRRRMRYTLGYPNNEVKYGLLESLAPAYLYDDKGRTSSDIFTLDDYIEEGNTDGIKDILTSLYARLPYTTDERPLEQNFQNVIYIVFSMLGKFVQTEIHSAKGRADVIVETEDFVYIFEFKRDKSAREALTQIEEKGYADAYAADRRTLYRIGVNFNSEKRELDGWEVESYYYS